jgi:hypothetical protein
MFRMFRSLTASLLISTISAAATAHADDVEIYLTDMLDNIQNGYCLDIAGGREAEADPVDGLQGHTCYSPGGALGVDQTFDTERFADNVLYMTKFNVCAEVTSFEAGTSVGLATCDSGESQSFVFSGDGAIGPAAAPALCLTVGETTRTGRSKRNQIKILTLEACSEDKAAYQNWSTRTVE